MSFRTKLILFFLIFGVVGGLAIGYLLSHFLPEYYSAYFVEIFIGLTVLELFILYWVESQSRKLEDKKLAMLYMGIMSGKMLAVLFAIVLYALVAKQEVEAFSMSFASLFLYFLALESVAFVKIEKRLKELKLNKK